jgi:hypothetical protein
VGDDDSLAIAGDLDAQRAPVWRLDQPRLGPPCA